jgi:hypothetical protein|tara:strand:+ start:425 stop:901 length:477 start_codon:yes stop_codon:yes gene_type:complete
MKRNDHNQNVGSKVVRSNDRIDSTGEVFTPMELCMEMVSEIPESILKDENSTFLDNSAGSGNFLLALQTELLKYHELSHINDNMLYAVELMEDNHAEMCKRLGVSVDHPHFVRADALKYDYGFGKPVALENELGKIEPSAPAPPKRTIDKKGEAAPLF